MTDENLRPVRVEVSLIDIDEEMPTTGSLVFALGLGGKLCEIVWRSDSHEFFKAWMPYPKVPRSVKRKLYEAYCSGEGWGIKRK